MTGFQMVFDEFPKQSLGFLCILCYLRSAIQLPEGHRGKGLRECIAAFADGQSFTRYMKPHSSILGVKAITLQEIACIASQIQPFFATINVIEEFGKQPASSALLPDTFVGVDDRSIPIQTGHEAAMSGIKSVLYPKWQDILQ